MTNDNLGTLTELPNGTAVYCLERERDGRTWHEYYRAKRAKASDGWTRGKRMTGVTTAIKPMDFDPGRLLQWAAKTQLLGVVELLGDSGIYDLGEMTATEVPAWLGSAEGMWNELSRRQLTFEDVRDRAGKRGTNVHQKALQALASGAPVPEFEGLTTEERGYANGVVEWWLDADLSADDVLNVEQVVGDEELGVAGRFDLRAKIGGEVTILDLKTSGFVGHSAHVQVAGYDSLARRCGIGGSDALAILQVREDGGYEWMPVEAEAADFEAALDVYRRAGRIKKAASHAWKERQGEF